MCLGRPANVVWGWGAFMTNWAPRRSTGGIAGAEHDLERRTQQIKEMVRLGSALRAEMGLENIYRQVVESINATFGFNVAAINIVREQSDYLEVVATAGLSPTERAALARPPRAPKPPPSPT